MNSTKPQPENPFENYGGNAPENYERYFVPVIGGPLAKELMEVAALKQGERVLDVACGTGIVARLAADFVGKTGKVVAVDMNAAMLNVAQNAAAGKSIVWRESNAENLPFENDSFDVVLSQLGLQFFQNRAGAVSEMRRVLCSGGRVLVRTAGPTPELFTIFQEALAQHVSKELSAFVQKVFSFYDKEEIYQMFSTAGFQDISIRQESKTVHLPEPQEFLWQYVSSTPLAGPLAQVDDATRSALQQELVTRWEPFVEKGRMHLNIPDVLTIAYKS